MGKRVTRDPKSGLKWIDKPDSVMVPSRDHSDHSSCPVIAHGVERPYPRVMGGPPDPPIWSCSGWGLPGVHHHWWTGELLPRLFTLTHRKTMGGIFSVVLSPDQSEPPLAATLSCGVRTFLPPPEAESDRLIHSSPMVTFCLRRRCLG
jgi:hypothetical protein